MEELAGKIRTNNEDCQREDKTQVREPKIE
jgi:hypothetical protein